MTAARSKGLSDKHRLFAHIAARAGESAASAYRKVYPKASQRTSEVEGTKLLRKPAVAALVAKLREKDLAKADSKREEVLAELHHVGLARLSRCLDVQPDGEVKIKPVDEWTEAERAAVSKVKVQAIFEGTGEDKTHVGNLVSLEAGGKMAALNTLAEHHKLVGDADGELSFRLEDLLMAARKRRELRAREAGGGAK